MPYTSPASQSAAAIATAAYANSLKAALDYLANPPACRATRTTNQTIPTSVDTKIVFNATDSYDTLSMHSTSVNPSRIVVPDAGLYAITGLAKWTTGGPATITAVYANGAELFAMRHDEAATTFHQTVSDIVKLAAGTYVELNVFHLAGADRVVNAATLSVVWVGLG